MCLLSSLLRREINNMFQFILYAKPLILAFLRAQALSLPLIPKLVIYTCLRVYNFFKSILEWEQNFFPREKKEEKKMWASVLGSYPIFLLLIVRHSFLQYLWYWLLPTRVLLFFIFRIRYVYTYFFSYNSYVLGNRWREKFNPIVNILQNSINERKKKLV